jgi:hypothetical protein
MLTTVLLTAQQQKYIQYMGGILWYIYAMRHDSRIKRKYLMKHKKHG